VIHLAFKHETMRTGDFMGAVDSDLAATRAIGETLIDTDKPFVTTGGTLMLAMAESPAGRVLRTINRMAVPESTRRTTPISLGQPGRSFLCRPARADGSQRPRPPRLHLRPDRLRPWRAVPPPTSPTAPQPLAGGQLLRHRCALPA